MIEFRALGSIGLADTAAGEICAVLAQPKRVALLTYLAIARPSGFHRRDTLLALFWPEGDERHARWALNQSLHYLRGALGANMVRSRGASEIGLDRESLWCDAVALESACGERRWEAALDLYRGDLLQGFHLSGCAEFDRWLGEERSRLRGLAARASWALADQLEAGRETDAAVGWARRALALSPHDEAGVRRLVQLLERTGDRGGAVQAYQEHARWLRDELELDPAPETQRLIAAVRSREATAGAQPPDANSPDVATVRPRSADAGRGELRAAVLRPVSRPRREPVLAALLGVTAVAMAAVVWWKGGASSTGSRIPGSIAVIPCSTAIAGTTQRYLDESISDELIEQVARSRIFEKVIASASVARYRASTKSPQEIGSELGVDALLYCHYRQSGSKERVSVQVVERRSGRLLWSDTFDRDFRSAGVSLAVHVVDALARAAGPGRSDRRRTDSPALATGDLEALNLYKEGRYLLNRYTEDALRQGITLFRGAIARDSQFASPWVGLARAYYLLGIAHGSLEPREAFPLMKQAAERALSLDGGLAEAHALLGDYELNFGWGWAAAEQRLREAIRLDPYAPQPLQSLAYYLTLLGRYDEVPALDAKAIGMSPADPFTWVATGMHQFLAGSYDEALGSLTRGLEFGPNLHPTLLLTGDLYAEMGDTRRAVAYLERADSISGHQVIVRGRLGYAYALAGDSAAARAILRDLKRGAAGGLPPGKTATAIACVHTGLGEPDSAFAWLDIAYQQHSGNLVHELRTPTGRRLSSDPRYAALLERVGLRPMLRTVVEEAGH